MNNENGIFNLIYNNINLVYDALVKTLKTSPNFELLSEEPAVHIVHATIGKSLFSQGEELIIKLEPLDENKTKLQITSGATVGIADNLRAKYGDTFQKLIDKMSAILPPPVIEEAPKPNNMVQVGELSRQMNPDMQNNNMPNPNMATSEPTSLNQALSQNNNQVQPMNNNQTEQVSNNQQTNSTQESTYAYEPKPFDYESLKENESSKHQGNDPLQDLMRNL